MLGDTIADERVVDGGHDEVSNTTTSVTKTSSQGVCGSDDVLVEESSGPYLARDERATEYTNEETDGVEASRAGDGTSQESGDSTDEQACCKGDARAKAITCGTSDETNQECCSEGNDIGVGNLMLGELHVFCNDIAEERREGIP